MSILILKTMSTNESSTKALNLKWQVLQLKTERRQDSNKTNKTWTTYSQVQRFEKCLSFFIIKTLDSRLYFMISTINLVFTSHDLGAYYDYKYLK